MKPAEKIEAIIRVEQSFEVQRWQSHGIQLWPIIRNRLGPALGYSLPPRIAKLDRNPDSSLTSNSTPTSTERLGNERQSVPLLQKQYDVIFLGSATGRTLLDGSHIHRLHDPLRIEYEKEGWTCLQIEYFNKTPFNRRLDSLSVDSLIEGFLSKGWLEHSTTSLRFEYPDNINDFWSAIREYVEDLETLRSKIFYSLTHTLYYREAFRKFLHEMKPKIVYVDNYPGDLHAGLILACHERGIPSVDIQHGYSSELHTAYGNWSKVPSIGYNSLPSIFWCWSNSSKESIDKWATAMPHTSFLGGQPFLNYWAENKRIDTDKSRNKNELRILYTGTQVDDLQFLSRVIASCPGSWIWDIRLHPCNADAKQSTVAYLADLNIPNFRIHTASEKPIFECFDQSDIHCTYFSTSTLEALNWQLPTACLHAECLDYFPNLAANGWLSHISQPEEATSVIETLLANSNDSPIPSETMPIIRSKEALKRLHQSANIPLL